MPSFEKDKTVPIKDIIAKGGKSKATMRKEARVIKIFDDFVQHQHNEDADGVFDNLEKLEDIILGFLYSLRVGEGRLLQKKW